MLTTIPKVEGTMRLWYFLVQVQTLYGDDHIDSVGIDCQFHFRHPKQQSCREGACGL